MPRRPPIHRPVGWAQEQRARAERERERAKISGASYATKAWREIRDAFLKANPFCMEPSCTEVATHVDHRIPRRRGGSDHWSNLQSLCHSHHSEKTASGDGGFGNPTV